MMPTMKVALVLTIAILVIFVAIMLIVDHPDNLILVQDVGSPL